MAVQISILVGNASDLIALGYTTIEIWQSLDDGDTYNELTASAVAAAYVTSAAAQTTFRMGGHELRFAVDGGSEVIITFDPLIQYWTPLQVANRINEISPGIASSTSTQVFLTSTTTGRASSIEITYSDADDLGFIVGTTYGLDARIPLSTSFSYLYSDVSGISTARYKWRFSHNGVNPISDFSDYVLGASVPSISSSYLALCTAKFIGLDGLPRKTTIVIGMESNPSVLSGYTIVNSSPLVVTSDDLGYLQFTVVRNMVIRVAVEGTSFVREITVPDAASFDLITAMANAPDPFTVQSPAPFLIRRTV